MIKGVAFNVIAITAHLMQGATLHSKYIPISPGAFTSQEKLETEGVNYSYKITDAKKHPYFLKEMSPKGLADGDFNEVADDDAEEGGFCCTRRLPETIHHPRPTTLLEKIKQEHNGKPLGRVKPNLKVNLTHAVTIATKPKSLPLETIVENEVDSANLAAYITNGLVPLAESYDEHHKIVQEYIELDKEKSKSHFHGGTISFSDWSDLHLEQFFVHMLADILLKNTDAHYNQFGIDLKGNIIGFDKGKANLHDRYARSWDIPFGIQQLTFQEGIVYSGYVDFLSTHKEVLKKVLNSEVVNSAFERIEAINLKMKNYLGTPEFSVPPEENPEKFKRFYNSYMLRFKTLRSEVYHYFEVPPVPQ